MYVIITSKTKRKEVQKKKKNHAAAGIDHIRT